MPWITTSEYAQREGVSSEAVRGMVARGKLKSRKGKKTGKRGRPSLEVWTDGEQTKRAEGPEAPGPLEGLGMEALRRRKLAVEIRRSEQQTEEERARYRDECWREWTTAAQSWLAQVRQALQEAAMDATTRRKLVDTIKTAEERCALTT